MIPTGRVVLGLSVGGPRPAELDHLIYAIGRQSVVVNMDGYTGRVDWMLVFRSPFRIPDGAPAAWYLANRADIEQVRRPSLILSGDQALLDACETTAPKVLITPSTVRYDDARPYAPYPRQRIRRARGLPSAVVGEVGAQRCVWDGHVVDPKFADTILITASAVISDQASVLLALGCGAPTVTDPATAEAIGARHDEHVRVGSDHQERQRLAAELADDMAAAARLSWAGRTLFEQVHSMPHLVARIENAITKPAGPAARISRVLAALGTPDDAPIRARAARLYNLPRSAGSAQTIGES